MKPQFRIFFVLILAAAIVLWFFLRKPAPDPVVPAAAPVTKAPPVPDIIPPSPALPPRIADPAVDVGNPPLVSLDDRKKAHDAIDNLEFVFRDYADALGGNPVGTNAEITAALLGDNLRQLKLQIPSGSSQNDQAELCDPWGSPWFFHQLSGIKMEIRSAGPDRRMWTEDDLIRD